MLAVTYEAFYEAQSFDEIMFLRCLIEHLKIAQDPLDLLSLSYDQKMQNLVRNIIIKSTIYVGAIE